MSVAGELGPTLPSRGALRAAAMEAGRLARVIEEITVEGPRCDVSRAARLMDRLRAVVGPVAQDSEGE